MLVRKFEFGEDQEYGDNGWLPTWMNGANAVNGFGAAHDILEHHPNMELGAEAEFHALGAAYWIRGETGVLAERAYRSAEDIISGEFVAILERVAYGNESLKRPPNTRPLSEYYFGTADEVLRDIVRNGVKLARDEWVYRAEDDGEFMPIPLDAEQRILGWMRMGYRYAVKRYGIGRQFDVAYLFKEIASEIDKHKHADLGMEMQVSVNLRRMRCSVKSYYPGEELY